MATTQTVRLELYAENLDRKDLFGLGRSDPYLVIKKVTSEAQDQEAFDEEIYRTETIDQN